MRKCYDTCLSEPSAHEFTKSGNMKAPSRKLICNWVKSSWDTISHETIRKSFKSCGITTATDGTDEDEIHCFKEGQPCLEGHSFLREKMEELQSIARAAIVDPFALENGDVEEENEVIIDAEVAESEIVIQGLKLMKNLKLESVTQYGSDFAYD